MLDAYAAAWFFTTNPEFFSHNAFVPGVQSQSQQLIPKRLSRLAIFLNRLAEIP